MDSFPEKPIAKWNPARDVWETDQTSLFCEHSGVYSEILPRSGMMRGGNLYRLPTPEPLIAGNGYSFGDGEFPTPASRDWKSGKSNLMERNARPLSEVVYNLLPTPVARDDHMPGEGFQMASLPREVSLLPTPRASEGERGSEHPDKKKGRENGQSPTLSDRIEHLLPTPTASMNEPAPWREGVDWWLQSRATRNLEGVVTGNTPLLPSPVARDYKGLPGKNVQMASLPREVSLLPTPSAGVFNDGESLQDWEERRQRNLEKKINGNGQGTPLAIAVQQDWGIFSAAIARWEAVLGRPSPIPTEPGRTAPRLSPRFVEFLMGLPDGWVVDVPGLARKHQLHALGNGCVPQQAVLALRIMLGDT